MSLKEGLKRELNVNSAYLVVFDVIEQEKDLKIILNYALSLTNDDYRELKRYVLKNENYKALKMLDEAEEKLKRFKY